MAVQKISDSLKKMLQDAIARELQVSIQYMWQHVVWRGVKGYAVKDAFEEIAIAEMKHAEKIAERLFYLTDEYPTTKPNPITVGNNLRRCSSRTPRTRRTRSTSTRTSSRRPRARATSRQPRSSAISWRRKRSITIRSRRSLRKCNRI